MYRIQSGHPAIKGHFPGNPVVPGVIILNHVLMHLKQKGLRVVMFDNVKFLVPLLPEEDFNIKLKGGACIFTFQVLVQQKIVVKGKVKTEVAT